MIFILKPALKHQPLSISWKVMKKMNGLHLLNLILNYSRKNKNSKKWDKKNSEKKSKTNSIDNLLKKKEDKKKKRLKNKPMFTSKDNNWMLMIEEKDKRKMIDSLRSWMKRDREISKSMMRTKERKLIREERRNWMRCWLPESRRRKTRKTGNRQIRRKEKSWDS